MRIGELASRTGLDPATIRFYEAEGVLPEPPRADNGYRDYGPEHVSAARFVRSAREIGFSLDDVREIVRIRSEGRAPCSHVRDLIDRQIADVDGQISALRTTRGELHALRDRASELEDHWEEGTCVCHLIER
jgi:DNA-binding transcriptional MerR regulator